MYRIQFNKIPFLTALMVGTLVGIPQHTLRAEDAPSAPSAASAPSTPSAPSAVSAPSTLTAKTTPRVSQERLRADIDALVGFGTRHTMSVQDHPTRGIGAARKWGEAEFRKASSACGDCLEISLPERMVQGRRIPTPTRLVNVVAIQRGTTRPNEVVIIQGHIDSRVSDVGDFTSDAPGANDDGSGTALVVEAARILSHQSFPTTIVYALLSGEEQGLYGGRLMADYAAEQGWSVKAVLNNDIVGGSCGSDGYCDAKHIRVFSEGPRADLTPDLRAQQRRNGGENDSPSRNLSRWIDQVADEEEGGLNVRQIWRTDRMGRGGDHIPFLEKGFPAIRFSVAVEDYEHQHQDLRVENGTTYGDTADEMDFSYLAKAVELNIHTAAKLAHTPIPPSVSIAAAVRNDTLLRWQYDRSATHYRIYKRASDQALWEAEPLSEVTRLDAVLADAVPADTVPADAVPADTAKAPAQDGTKPVHPRAKLEYKIIIPLRGDDWIFGVSACGDTGHCSPVSSAVPAGAFVPVAQTEGDSS